MNILKASLFLVLLMQWAMAEEAIPSKKRKYDQTFKVQYSQSFMKVEARADAQNKGLVRSSSIPGFIFTWTPWRFDKAQLGFSYGYQNAHFKPSESRTIINDDQELSRYTFGGNYNLADHLDLNFQLGAANQIFFRSLHPDTVKLNSVQVGFTQAGLSYDFSIGPFVLSAKGAGRVHFPFHKDPYKGRSGYGYTGSLGLNYGRKDFLLQFEGFFAQDLFQLSSVDFKKVETGIVGGVIIPIGGPLSE